MTTQKLQTKLRRNNLLQISLGATLAVLAPALWIGSFWAARYLFYLPASRLGFQGMWDASLYVGWGFTALLAFEGLRNSHPLFDLKEYAESDFNWREKGNVPGTIAIGYGYDPMADAWLVTQLLFLAPRTTVLAVQALRSVIRASPGVIDRAAAIFNDLRADHRWHAARDFGDCGPAIRLLSRLRLIWLQRGERGLELRFPAAMTEAELV